jgi:hypothetical protein
MIPIPRPYTCVEMIPLDLALATCPAWHVEEVRVLSPMQRRFAAMQRRFNQKIRERLHVEH